MARSVVPVRTPQPPWSSPLLRPLAVALALTSLALLRQGLRSRRLALYSPIAFLVLAAAFLAGCGGAGRGTAPPTGTPPWT